MTVNVITECSLLNSLIKLDNLIDFLLEKKLSYCGICDNELFGSTDFYFKCKKNNIKPIIGLKVFIEDKEIYIYPKNYEGYKKLLKINTKKFNNNLLYEDVTDKNLYIVIPYKSLDLYVNFGLKENIYLGYKNNNEKTNMLLLSNNIIYLNEARTLKKEEIKYLDYLIQLGGNFNYYNDSYLNVNISEDDKKTIDDFASNIDIEIPLNERYMPKYCNDSKKYLDKLAHTGLVKRIANPSKEYLDRLDEELKVINDLGFTDYFLIVYDYVLYAKKNNIMVGPGRGSAAGSLVSYVIGITDIDPIKYDLLFSRFLNPSRSKMPDIDIDFEDQKRSEVINYVKNKYENNNVALGLTFSTYKSKLILRDLAKVLKIDSNLFEKFIKEIEADKSLKENLEKNTIKKYLNYYPEIKKLYEIAIHLENLKKNISTHAAAVIICSNPLDDIIPTYVDGDELKTGIEVSEQIEKLGLLKMDFLGLRNLTLLKELSNKSGISLNNIPLDDKKVYDLFKKCDTDDIFQFESSYAKKCLEKLQIDNFDDLVCALALVRPGAKEQIEMYVNNRTNGFDISPEINEILKDSHGVMIYQEQVIKIFEKVGGYTSYEADSIRRAISKKDEQIILKEKDNFILRGKKKYEVSFLEKLFGMIVKFSEYGFNKSHSVAYSHISYYLAYFKVNYPVIFVTCLLENSKDSGTRKKYLNYLKTLGVKILKPNINLSTNKFMYKNNNLLLPFTIIKQMSNDLVNKIINNRPFKDIYDLFLKCDINEKEYATLVYSGLLDLFKINKNTLISNYDILKNYSFLGDAAQKPELNILKEYDDSFIREKESEYYDFYIGNHPCSVYKNKIKLIDTEKYLFKNIDIVVMIEKIKVVNTKKGDQMAFILVSDESCEKEIIMFSKLYEKYNNLKEKDILFMNVKSSKRFDKYELIVNNIKKEVIK